MNIDSIKVEDNLIVYKFYLLQLITGDQSFQNFLKHLQSDIERYKQLTSWKKTKVFHGYTTDLAEETEKLKDSIFETIGQALMVRRAFFSIQDWFHYISTTFSIQPDEDPYLQPLKLRFSLLKENTRIYFSSKNRKDDAFNRIVSETADIYKDLAGYMPYRGKTAGLNDWLDSEEMVRKALLLGDEAITEGILILESKDLDEEAR